jgi:acyl carrier protein
LAFAALQQSLLMCTFVGSEDKAAWGRMLAKEQVVARIARLFEDELGATDVGPDTHFIFSGGDSLNAESLVVALGAEFGVPLKTAALLDAPTPREMAELILGLIKQNVSA